MNQAQVKEDKSLWDKFWLDSYFELGGTSKESGSKGCPKTAAYGLWNTGFIKGKSRPFRNWKIDEIKNHYGKNTAYAAIAVYLLRLGWDQSDISGLWDEVRRIYMSKFHDTPAQKDQGAARVTAILFQEGQISSTQNIEL